MTPACFQGTRLNIMAISRGSAAVTKEMSGQPSVFRCLVPEGRCGTVSEQMEADRVSEGGFGALADLSI